MLVLSDNQAKKPKTKELAQIMDYFEAKRVKQMNQGNFVIHRYKSYIIVITLPCFANTLKI